MSGSRSSGRADGPVDVVVERLFREQSGRALATLVRLLGDLDRAEEAVQEAFTTALERWPRDGVPANPLAWIVTTGRNRAIDRLRRDQRFPAKARQALAAIEADGAQSPGGPGGSAGPGDDRLRLVFTCCHPALRPEAQVALTLRLVAGLSVAEVARAFVVSEPTVARRLVRAKQKIREAGIPYRIPSRAELPERLEPVLSCLYLVFNEGYTATSDESLVRRELCAEAIRLARLVRELLPDAPEAAGLLALLLLHDARREARLDRVGELVLLADQDRRRWDRGQIAEGVRLTAVALAGDPPGPFALQAAIAAEHTRAATFEDTNWAVIVALYQRLAMVAPSPVVALNHGVAVAMAQGPQQGLDLIDTLPGLDRYHLYHAARADLLRRLGDRTGAAAAYRRALALATQPTERSFLHRRLTELS